MRRKQQQAAVAADNEQQAEVHSSLKLENKFNPIFEWFHMHTLLRYLSTVEVALCATVSIEKHENVQLKGAPSVLAAVKKCWNVCCDDPRVQGWMLLIIKELTMYLGTIC
uniref:Uncharacterized protein n=1 Tax=Oryza glumipatula TaxID=40148 RepID=A0A0E0B1D6_9ORYZ